MQPKKNDDTDADTDTDSDTEEKWKRYSILPVAGTKRMAFDKEAVDNFGRSVATGDRSRLGRHAVQGRELIEFRCHPWSYNKERS